MHWSRNERKQVAEARLMRPHRLGLASGQATLKELFYLSGGEALNIQPALVSLKTKNRFSALHRHLCDGLFSRIQAASFIFFLGYFTNHGLFSAMIYLLFLSAGSFFSANLESNKDIFQLTGADGRCFKKLPVSQMLAQILIYV